MAEDGWWVGVSSAADGMKIASADRASEYFYEDLTGSGISQWDGRKLPWFLDTLEEGSGGVANGLPKMPCAIVKLSHLTFFSTPANE